MRTGKDRPTGEMRHLLELKAQEKREGQLEGAKDADISGTGTYKHYLPKEIQFFVQKKWPRL